MSSLIVLAGCARYELFVPEYKNFTPPPDELTIEQLVSDYMADEVAADTKYKGRTFLFTGVEIEEARTNLNTYPPPLDVYLISGLVKFTPRYNTGFDDIEKTFVVDIIGECQGWQFSRVLIADCWVGIIEGDLANIPRWEY